MPRAVTFMHRLCPSDYTFISSKKERKERMTATVIDSTIFRHIFSRETMPQVFSDENTLQSYPATEASLPPVHASLRLLPHAPPPQITPQNPPPPTPIHKLQHKPPH